MSPRAPLRIMMNLLHAQRTLTGSGYYSLCLARALLDLPERPQILGVCSPINRESFRIEGKENYSQIVWGRPWNNVMARRIEEWIYLNDVIRAKKPSLFFGPSNFLPPRRSGVPNVVTIHDMTFFRHPDFLTPARRIYWHRWTRRTIKVADLILTDSEASRDDIIYFGNADPSRIQVIPIGTDERFFVGADREGHSDRFNALLERFPNLPQRYVFFLGTLTSHKNVPRLVEAVARARAMGCDDMHLVLAGKRGTGYDKVAAAIERNSLGSVVHELGYVEDEFMPALYENASTAVLPSFTEGFGLPITESMACGTPVVTSNCSSMAEIAGEAAILVDPWNVEDMSSGLKRFWSDPALRREYRARGLERARLYTWPECARKTYDAFAGIV
ncbi:glycosyltransferase family 4 protein [bacterium]|nr:glycosyltransferase family 4 protein [bacterium]